MSHTRLKVRKEKPTGAPQGTWATKGWRHVNLNVVFQHLYGSQSNVEAMQGCRSWKSQNDLRTWARHGWSRICLEGSAFARLMLEPYRAECIFWRHDWYQWVEPFIAEMCSIHCDSVSLLLFFLFLLQPLLRFQALASSALSSKSRGVQVVQHPPPIACAWPPQTSCSAPLWDGSHMQSCCIPPYPTLISMFKWHELH